MFQEFARKRMIVIKCYEEGRAEIFISTMLLAMMKLIMLVMTMLMMTVLVMIITIDRVGYSCQTVLFSATTTAYKCPEEDEVMFK